MKPPEPLMVVVTNLCMGGAEIQALRNCEVLLEAGHRVALVTVFRSDRDFFADEMERLRATFATFSYHHLLDEEADGIPAGRQAPRKLLACVSRLRALVLAHRPEVLYTRLWYPSLVAWLTSLSVKARPRLIFNEENSLKHNASRLRGWLRLFLLNRADLWLTPCESLYREAVALGACAERGLAMPNITPIPPAPAGAHGGGDRPLRLGFLGRLEKQKGLDRLIEMLASLEAHGCDFTIAIAGEGRLEGFLRQSLDARGLASRSRLLGAVKDTAAFFAELDMLVLTSYHEGFANVLVEAHAHGVPTAAMRVPHGPEDIVLDGVNGYLFADGDVAGMARRLAELDRGKLAAMRPACRESAEARFSSATQAQRWRRALALAAIRCAS